MKGINAIACLVLIISVGSSNGLRVEPRYEPQDIYAEPNCAVVTDHTRMFRDISDPTHYWICPEGKEKADYIQCPPDEAFMEQPQRCVKWSEWKWVEPYTK
uniref:Chitin-binding type-2 domain-containing protein n=1 Tax=Glossina brevipalpis TaxID=37001 RepID=A0A1A9W5U1_9MUSC